MRGWLLALLTLAPMCWNEGYFVWTLLPLKQLASESYSLRFGRVDGREVRVVETDLYWEVWERDSDALFCVKHSGIGPLPPAYRKDVLQ